MPVSLSEKSLFRKLHSLFARPEKERILVGITSKENLLFTYRRRPLGWFNRHLSRFLEAAHCNVVTASILYPECFKKLCIADELLMRMTRASAEQQSEIFWSLIHQTHNFWLAAARMAMSGQGAQTYTMIRATVEHAAYASFLHRHAGTDIETIWIERENSPEACRKMRETFTWSAVSNSIRSKPTRRLVKTLYNHCISFGSHPNPLGVIDHLTMDNYSYFLDSVERQAELMKLVVQTALFVVLMFSEATPLFLKDLDTEEIFDGLIAYCRSGHRAA